MKAANILMVDNREQILPQLTYLQDYKMLTLCWRLVSEWGFHRVDFTFAFERC